MSPTSTLKMVIAGKSEMLVTFYQTTQRPVSKDSDVDIHQRHSRRTHKENFFLLLRFHHRIGKGSGCDLFQDNTPAFAWKH
jgi:hypothetical protein